MITKIDSFKRSELARAQAKLLLGGSDTIRDTPSLFSNVLYTPRSNDLHGWPYALPTTGEGSGD